MFTATCDECGATFETDHPELFNTLCASCKQTRALSGQDMSPEEARELGEHLIVNILAVALDNAIREIVGDPLITLSPGDTVLRINEALIRTGAGAGMALTHKMALDKKRNGEAS